MYIEVKINEMVVNIIQLQEIAQITQGVISSRAETSADAPNATFMNVLTLKEFNEVLGLPYRMVQDKKNAVWVSEKWKDKIAITEEHTIVIHLLTQLTASIPSKFKGYLVPSNFAVIQFNQPTDANFIEWYFNEDPDIRKQFSLFTQGSTIGSLSINLLREMIINLPPIETQITIGKISAAKRRKKLLIEERMELEEQRMNELLIRKMEEYK